MNKFTAFVLAGVLAFILTGCGEKHPVVPAMKWDTPAAVSLEGHWHQTQSDMPNVIMDADISNGSILIRMDWVSHGSGVYWAGTFDSTYSGSHQVSSVDSDLLSGSIFASRDDSKEFTYQDGELSYYFTMLGRTTTVRLAKGA